MKALGRVVERQDGDISRQNRVPSPKQVRQRVTPNCPERNYLAEGMDTTVRAPCRNQASWLLKDLCQGIFQDPLHGAHAPGGASLSALSVRLLGRPGPLNLESREPTAVVGNLGPQVELIVTRGCCTRLRLGLRFPHGSYGPARH
jgi:hypothetical protein